MIYTHCDNRQRQLGDFRIGPLGTFRQCERIGQESNPDHGWRARPLDGFAELAFAVGDAVDRERDEAGDLVGRDLEEVEA